MASYIENIKSSLDWFNSFIRTGSFPLDRSSMFSGKTDAAKYASGTNNEQDMDGRKLSPTSYIGQTITVYEDDKVDSYLIGADRSLKKIVLEEELKKNIDEIQNSLITEDGIKDVISGETISANKVETLNSIPILGGPLGKLLNPTNNPNMEIQADNLYQILSDLLYKELWPENLEVKTPKPSPSLNAPSYTLSGINSSNIIEVGTSLKVSNITLSQPSLELLNKQISGMEYGYKLENADNSTYYSATTYNIASTSTSITNGNYTIEVTYTGFTDEPKVTKNMENYTQSVSLYEDENKELIVAKDENTILVTYTTPKVQVEYPSFGPIYYCSNTLKTNNERCISGNTEHQYSNYPSSTKSITIYGKWLLYYGGITYEIQQEIKNGNTDKIDSSFIRGLNSTKIYQKGTYTIDDENICYGVIIAYPKEWGSLKKVLTEKGDDYALKFTPKEIDFYDVKGKVSHSYVCYYYPTDTNLSGYNYTITIS